jgi:NAD(P)-dependent dehydrogenase (short-subunit alcohol dehydrogenase family)
MPTSLVTGANRGIGLEICRALRARGDAVVATTRTGRDDALRAMGCDVVALDVGDAASIDALPNSVERVLGGRAIDVLYNNAGVSSEAKTLVTVTQAELARVFAVNAFAPLLVVRAILPLLRAGSRRVVLNVSSQLASIANNTGGSSYAYRASKTALNQLTVCLANELRGEGFCCVNVHPGWVRTDMGGPQAPMLPPDSARHLIALADRLTPADTGKFLNFDGAAMPW